MNPINILTRYRKNAPVVMAPYFKLTITTTESDTAIELPFEENYNYDAVVDWGDTTQSTITAWDDADKTHTYTVAGTYIITITGICESFGFVGVDYRSYYVGVDFGTMEFKKIDSAFNGCANLASVVGSIHGETITTVQQLFISCTSLESVPSKLFKLLSNLESLSHCFYGSGLTVIPVDLFRYNTLATDFMLCFILTPISVIPADIFKYNTQATSFYATFSSTNVSSIPADLFRYNTLATNFSSTFSSTNVSSIPADIFKYNVLANSFTGTFQNLTSLTTVPTTIFDTITNLISVKFLFYNCTSLTTEWELWLPTAGNTTYGLTAPDYDAGTPDGEHCFYNCTSRSDYASIPAYWKSENI